MNRFFSNKFLKESKILGIALICGLIFTFTIGFLTYAYSENTQNEISQQVIRLHVKANSDLQFDQSLKETVRDSILEKFRIGLESSQSKDETRQFIQENLDEIEKLAQEVVNNNGYNYPVSAEITHEYFPTKTYANIALPAGEYEALRINIGEAKGSNWWCVMFPPLCYVDETHSTISEEQNNQLKSVLSSETYNLVSRHSEPDVVVKFKLVELWQELMH